MAACQQTPTQNMIEHGEAVADKFEELYEWLEYPCHDDGCSQRAADPPFKVPTWVSTYREELLTAVNKHSLQDIRHYHEYHDCGKPYCRTIDNEGKQHFHGHTEVSARVHASTFPSLVLPTLWVAHDMDVHVLKSREIPEFLKLPGAIVLLLTGLAELEANRSMFGDGTSYKIKLKHLDRRGKAICKHLWGA
jgi:hypothetical protein